MQFKISALLAVACISVYAQTNEVVKVKVTGDRVSLRAKPDINSELLDRAMRGEELVLLGATNEWVAVQAPDSLDFWVSGEFVQNGIVVPAKLNIRSGPSQNYSVVYVANQGEPVALRDAEEQMQTAMQDAIAASAATEKTQAESALKKAAQQVKANNLAAARIMNGRAAEAVAILERAAFETMLPVQKSVAVQMSYIRTAKRDYLISSLAGPISSCRTDLRSV